MIRCGAIAMLMLAGCQGDKATELVYASYEDCVLDKLGRGQSTVASNAIIQACRSKHPELAVASGPWERYSPPRSAAPFENLIPAYGSDEAVPDAQALTFHGYYCTSDCSGHESGYEWAEENDISEPEDCGGNSQSFIEGCEAWAADY